jgi:serine/threonine protein kinase
MRKPMGIVFEARQRSLDRTVPLKMVRAGRFAGEEDRRRFRNVAEAEAKLDHPNIVPVYEVGEHEGHNYFSVKRIEGISLAANLSGYRDIPHGRRGSWPRSRRRCTMPTSAACSIATSNRPTSSLMPAVSRI